MTKRIQWTDEEWMAVCVALRQIQGSVGAAGVSIKENLHQAQVLSKIHPTRYRNFLGSQVTAYEVRKKLKEVENVLLERAHVTIESQPVESTGTLQGLVKLRESLDTRIAAAHAKALAGDGSGIVKVTPGPTPIPGVLDAPISKIVQQAIEAMAPMLMEQISKDMQLSGLQQLQASVNELNSKMNSIIKAFDIPLEVILAEAVPSTVAAVQAPITPEHAKYSGTSLKSEIQSKPAKITRKVLIVGPTPSQYQALSQGVVEGLEKSWTLKMVGTKEMDAANLVKGYDMVLVMTRFVGSNQIRDITSEAKKHKIPLKLVDGAESRTKSTLLAELPALFNKPSPRQFTNT